VQAIIISISIGANKLTYKNSMNSNSVTKTDLFIFASYSEAPQV